MQQVHRGWRGRSRRGGLCSGGPATGQLPGASPQSEILGGQHPQVTQSEQKEDIELEGQQAHEGAECFQHYFQAKSDT